MTRTTCLQRASATQPVRWAPVGAWAAWALLCGAPLWPKPALAFECSRVLDNSGTPEGSGLAWPARSIPYAFSQQATSKLDDSAAQDTVRQAFATWQNSTLRDGNTSCGGLDTGVPMGTDIVFEEGAPVSETFAGFNYFDPNDNHSTLLFRDDVWPYPLGTSDSTERMALTTVTFNKLTGIIVDADIEFNTLGYQFTIGDDNVVWDLLNIATHEVGHFLGFAHTTVTDATMYNLASYGETFKRTLSCDDASILWFRYPAQQKMRSCGMGNLNDKCGFCAAPGVLSNSPDIRLNRTDGGQGGCSCRALAPLDQGLLGTLLALCTWRRRRAARARAAAPRQLVEPGDKAG